MEAKDTKEILAGIQEIKLELAKFSVHQEQHRKEIDYLNKKIYIQEKNQNRFFGAISIIGVGLSAFFTWLFKHF